MPLAKYALVQECLGLSAHPLTSPNIPLSTKMSSRNIS